MLAENFKTAKQLGLSEESLKAHIAVLRKLERGELTMHCSTETIRNQTFFTMANWMYCLRGQVVREMGHDDPGVIGMPRRKWSRAQIDLYCPPESAARTFGGITVPQTACALRNYLTTGRAQWKEALA